MLLLMQCMGLGQQMSAFSVVRRLVALLFVVMRDQLEIGREQSKIRLDILVVYAGFEKL